MYSASHQSIPASASMNGMGGGLIDGSGTINPAALNSALNTPGKYLSTEWAPLAKCLHWLLATSRETSSSMRRVDPLIVYSQSLTSSQVEANIDAFYIVPHLPTASSINTSSISINANISPRGLKRSRTPENSGDAYGGAEDGTCYIRCKYPCARRRAPGAWRAAIAIDHSLTTAGCTDDQKPKKRGRPPKTKEDVAAASQVIQNNPDQLRTPQLQTSGLPLDVNSTPTQASPPKSTPTKAAVVKALPTVRDHTTDQLTAEGDEFIPREHDDSGDRKVSQTGEPLGGRQFKMRTFYVANRGEKRFMLATECARVLNYRDSYLLFNKNRSLHKIIATQAEKDELIQQEILPYSYRSRQIAIVTAKSMFRQFGARVIEGGRRVRDDYWESKAIKQGFTEEDMAGDKRPGATKAREATAALENANNPTNPAAYGQAQDVVYTNATMQNPNHPHPEGSGYPTMNPIKVEDSRQLAYGNVPRPQQEMTGTPYQDRTQPSPATDVMHQAANAAELNKQLAAQRGPRVKYLQDTWNREQKPPVSSPPQKTEESPVVSQSPHFQSNQQSLLQQQHQASQMMSPQSYSHAQPSHHQQNPHAQSPVRPDLRQQHRSSISYPPSQHAPQTSPYGYPPPNQMWGHPPPHPQQSPVSSHHPSLPQYSPSPHQQPPPQLQHHPSQSPHQQQHPQLPQLHRSQSSGSMHGSGGISYQQQMSNLPGGMQPGGASGFSNPQAMAGVRAMYPPQQSGSPGQYLQQQQQQVTSGAGQQGMQGWAPPGQQGGGGWQGYPNTSGY